MLISLNFLYLKKEKKKDEEKELPQIFCNQMGFYYLNAVMEVVSLFAGEFLLLSVHLCYPMAFSSLRFSPLCVLGGISSFYDITRKHISAQSSNNYSY